MTAEATRAACTPAEYLLRERAAEYKHEYRDGQIVAMTDASRAHNLIALNVAGELRQQLRGRPCEAYMGDLRVKVSQSGLYTYPDVVVVCAEIRFEDANLDTLLNPTVIVECCRHLPRRTIAARSSPTTAASTRFRSTC